MSLEHCAECGTLTGNAGKHDDSLYHAHEGPFCQECYDAWDELVIAERDRLRKLLATPAPIPDAGERLEVVGYLPVKTFCDDGEELMTVAQHNRIVSALQASALVVPDKRTSCAFCGKRQPETTSQGDK